MNKTLNLVIFIVLIVIFCLAAYLYINHTNKQYKEHFSLMLDSTQINEDEINLNNPDPDEDSNFNCELYTDLEQCDENVEYCNIVDDKCVNNSDEEK